MHLRTASLLLLTLFAGLSAAFAEREIEVHGFTGPAVDYVIKVDSLQALIDLTADPERKLLQAIETENTYTVVYRIGADKLVILMTYKSGTTGFPLSGPQFDNEFISPTTEFYSFVRYKILRIMAGVENP